MRADAGRLAREVPLLRVLLALVCLLSLATSAQAERVWMLWVESPAGSDQWSLAPIAEPGFKTEKDCQGGPRPQRLRIDDGRTLER